MAASDGQIEFGLKVTRFGSQVVLAVDYRLFVLSIQEMQDLTLPSAAVQLVSKLLAEIDPPAPVLFVVSMTGTGNYSVFGWRRHFVSGKALHECTQTRKDREV